MIRFIVFIFGFRIKFCRELLIQVVIRVVIITITSIEVFAFVGAKRIMRSGIHCFFAVFIISVAHRYHLLSIICSGTTVYMRSFFRAFL